MTDGLLGRPLAIGKSVQCSWYMDILYIGNFANPPTLNPTSILDSSLFFVCRSAKLIPAFTPYQVGYFSLTLVESCAILWILVARNVITISAINFEVFMCFFV